MARVKFSPLITSASGHVQDTVFSRWKGRPYIRSLVVPANPNTAAQQIQRNRMAAAVACWQAVSVALAAAWDAYGSPYSLSGFNSWCSANIMRMAIADVPLPQAMPPDPKAEPITTFTAVAGALNEITVGWAAGTWQAADTGHILFLKETGATYYPTIQLVATRAMNLGGYISAALTPGAVYTVIMTAYDDSEERWSTSVGLKAVPVGV